MIDEKIIGKIRKITNKKQKRHHKKGDVRNLGASNCQKCPNGHLWHHSTPLYPSSCISEHPEGARQQKVDFFIFIFGNRRESQNTTSPPRALHRQMHNEGLLLTSQPVGGEVMRGLRPRGRSRPEPATLALVLGLAAAYTYPDPPNMDPVVVPEAPVGRHSPAQTWPPPEWRRPKTTFSYTAPCPMISRHGQRVPGDPDVRYFI